MQLYKVFWCIGTYFIYMCLSGSNSYPHTCFILLFSFLLNIYHWVCVLVNVLEIVTIKSLHHFLLFKVWSSESFEIYSKFPFTWVTTERQNRGSPSLCLLSGRTLSSIFMCSTVSDLSCLPNQIHICTRSCLDTLWEFQYPPVPRWKKSCECQNLEQTGPWSVPVMCNT